MKKIMLGIMLVLALLIGQTGVAFAQAVTPISGTVQSVVPETDSAGVTTVLVTYTYTDGAGVQQTATSRLSVATAASLGLVVTDPITNITTATITAVGSTVTIDPATIIPEEPQHPVGSALSNFFTSLIGVDYDTVMDYHSDGTGFGVIAQALWLTNQTGGSTDTFTALLDAKSSGDYSGITLADGSTPDNWGDVVKSLNKGSNLGSVKSGKANSDSANTDSDVSDDETTTSATTEETIAPGNSDNGNSNNGNSNNGNSNSNNGNNNDTGSNNNNNNNNNNSNSNSNSNSNNDTSNGNGNSNNSNSNSNSNGNGNGNNNGNGGGNGKGKP